MHELGIIIHISKTLKEVAEENEVTKIGSVTLHRRCRAACVAGAASDALRRETV